MRKDYSRLFPMTLDEIQRFMAHLRLTPDGCWVWTGSRNSHGYGIVTIRGERWLAHRVAYMLFVGPPRPGLVIHHDCSNPSCCNPYHLEAVPQAENVRRGNIRRGDNHHMRRLTHCKHGHPYSGANLVWRNVGGRLQRKCRTCMTETARRYRARAAARELAGTPSPVSALSQAQSFALPSQLAYIEYGDCTG